MWRIWITVLTIFVISGSTAALEQALRIPELLREHLQTNRESRQLRQFANASPEIPRGVYSCGEQGTETITNFINPAYPASENTGGACRYRLLMRNKNVCQVRVDFVDTNLAKPDDGVCEDQYLELSGTMWPIGVKRFCGNNPDQHFYLEIPTMPAGHDRYIDFIVTTVRIDSPYKFGLWITQIDCTIMNVLQAPMSCFQYFLDSTGNIKSFNFDGGSYYTDQKYRICVRAATDACVVKVEAEEDEFNINGQQGGGLFNRLRNNRAAVGTDDCMDDYLLIPKSSEEGTENALTEDRYCGSILSSQSGDNEPYPIYCRIDNSLIVFGFYAGNQERDDNDAYDPGFKITYKQQNECPKEEKEDTRNRFMGLFNRRNGGGLFNRRRRPGGLFNRRRPGGGLFQNLRRRNNNRDDDDDDDDDE